MKILLFRKKTTYRPTFWFYLLFIVVLYFLIRLLLPGTHSFLAYEKPIQTKTMILEGWVSTYALPDVVEYYNNNGFERLIVTGIPMTQYEYASEYNYTSQATKKALKHFGFNDTIYEAAIPTSIYQDRTYSTALIAKSLFESHPEWEKNFDIYSMGVHTRRSLLLFKKAFGSEYNIGIISHTVRTYIGNQWWKSSVGFRTVSNEAIAFFYANFFFHPDKDDYLKRIDDGLFFDEHTIERRNKHFEFTDTLKSPFTKAEINDFHGFNYYDIDKAFKVKAQFSIDTTHPPFEMPTTTSRKPIYRIYGYLDFVLKDTMLRLTAFQNMDFINSVEYGNYLFVPFTDLTNGSETYGGGRYLDIEIPRSDSIELDFNSAYNPYCAYSKRWSCPLVPFENHLDIHLLAGEKKYK